MVSIFQYLFINLLDFSEVFRIGGNAERVGTSKLFWRGIANVPFFPIQNSILDLILLWLNSYTLLVVKLSFVLFVTRSFMHCPDNYVRYFSSGVEAFSLSEITE